MALISQLRAHVIHDLAPYICTFKECSTPDVLYATSRDWIQHLCKIHGTTSWWCRLCEHDIGDGADFDTAKGLAFHLRLEHPAFEDEHELAMFIQLSVRRKKPHFSCCEFCGWGPNQQPQNSMPVSEPTQEDFYNHMATNHLWPLALSSVPWELGDAKSDASAQTNRTSESDEHKAELKQEMPLDYPTYATNSNSYSLSHIKRHYNTILPKNASVHDWAVNVVTQAAPIPVDPVVTQLLPRHLKHDDYHVAWIWSTEIGEIAALHMLDEVDSRLPQPENDHNIYTLGSINGHNVVIAGPHTTGNCSAATVVAQMRNTFPQLKFGLLVGIGGGVPTKTEAGPIRLGHIVVSRPVGQHSGAVQYDHGKAEAGDFVRTGFLAPPPTVLLNAVSALQVHRLRAWKDPLPVHLSRFDTSKRSLRAYKRPSPDQDQLYEPDYIHLDKDESCKKCGCEASKRVNRDVEDSDNESAYEEDDDWLVVHRGTIASGEAVMRNGLQRDALAGIDKILCFEMEAAGALNDFPCLVVRGISDYSDTHKNDKWHGYAAAAAAAYTRELFYHMPVDEVKQCRIAETGEI